MKITSPKLMEYIKKNRYFATMRNYDYKVGTIINLTDEHGEIGKAVVVAVFLNTLGFRKATVKLSGFNDIGEWEREAMSYYEGNKRKLPRYIILCKVIELYAVEDEEIDMNIDTS